MSLAQRTIQSVGWNAAAKGVQTAVNLTRMLLLTRWLPVALFGSYAGLRVIIALTVTTTSFGLSGAFIHRAPETEDEEQATAVLFTLRLLFLLGWVGIMLLLLPWLTRPGEAAPYVVLLLAMAGQYQAQVVETILVRRVAHRRIAVVQTLGVLLSSIVMLLLAWFYDSIWVLVLGDVVVTAVYLIGYLLWQPIWRIRFGWNQQIVRYYLNFGRRGFAAQVLYQLLDRLDDLWVRLALGNLPLGYYSRAYNFATAPRQFLAMPLSDVAGGTYAALKNDRLRLSQAFFRTNALLVRSSFFLGGLLALVAPEFIRLALTEKWLPMLTAFRLMLIFTLLDPLKLTTASLIGYMGYPERIVQTRLVQLVVLGIGLFALGPRWGIAGVAVAVDVMLFVGIALFFWQVGEFVDYSLWAMFAMPALALLLAGWLARLSLLLPGVLGSDWRTGLVKTAVFTILYAATLFLTERQQMTRMIAQLRQHLPSRPRSGTL
ncbi:MAG: oligosaccharide flippase family protein [Chloroflexota bacterium]